MNKDIRDNMLRERLAKKLDDEHKIFLMHCLARDMTSVEARAELKKEYGITISTSWIKTIKDIPKYRKFFERYRDIYIKEYENIEKIHLSAKTNRLKEADNIASGINRIIGIIQKKLDTEGLEVSGENSKIMKVKSKKLDSYIIQLTKQMVSLADSYIQILKYCKEESKKENRRKGGDVQPSFLTQINIDSGKEMEPIEISQVNDEKTDSKKTVSQHASDGILSANI